MTTKTIKASKQGIVVKLSGEKTIKVEVKSYQTHAKYKKQFMRTKNFLVHDEKRIIEQSRPVSKRKSWALSSIEKAA